MTETPPPEPQTEPEGEPVLVPGIEQLPGTESQVGAPYGPTGMYRAGDLVTRARAWGTRPAVVRAAFKAKGVETMSLADAEAAVREYMSRPSVVPRRETPAGGQASW